MVGRSGTPKERKMASKHRTPPTLGKKGNMLEYDIIKPKPIFWLFEKVVKNHENFELLDKMVVLEPTNLWSTVRVLAGALFLFETRSSMGGGFGKIRPTHHHHPPNTPHPPPPPITISETGP